MMRFRYVLGRRLQSLEFVNPIHGKTESVTPTIARGMIGYLKESAKEQAIKAANEWKKSAGN